MEISLGGKQYKFIGIVLQSLWGLLYWFEDLKTYTAVSFHVDPDRTQVCILK